MTHGIKRHSTHELICVVSSLLWKRPNGVRSTSFHAIQHADRRRRGNESLTVYLGSIVQKFGLGV